MSELSASDSSKGLIVSADSLFLDVFHRSAFVEDDEVVDFCCFHDLSCFPVQIYGLRFASSNLYKSCKKLR